MQQYNWIDAKVLKMLHEECLADYGGGRGIRDIGLFESAIGRPENLAHYDENTDIADLAASYAYGLVNNHPFVDGNKRVAFLSIGLFLGINRHRLTAKPIDAIRAILAVASSEMSEKELSLWIRANIKTL